MVEHSPEQLDSIFHALADSTRRDILARLAETDLSIGELSKSYPMTLAAVSKHIRVLERAALVSITKSGRVRHCAFRGEALDVAAAQIAEFRRFWEQQLSGLENIIQARRASKAQPGANKNGNGNDDTE